MEWDFLRFLLFLLVPFESSNGHFCCLFGRGRTRGRSLALGARRDRPWARCRRWLLGAAELRFGGRLNLEQCTPPRHAFARRFLINALWDHTGRGSTRVRRQHKPKPCAKEQSPRIPGPHQIPQVVSTRTDMDVLSLPLLITVPYAVFTTTAPSLFYLVS